MVYVAMSRQSYGLRTLSEAQLATMSPSQVSLELQVLDSLKTKLLKAQGIHKVSNLVLEEQLAREEEEHKKTLKRQAKLLKEAMDQRPEVETLASRKRTYEPPAKIQR